MLLLNRLIRIFRPLPFRPRPKSEPAVLDPVALAQRVALRCGARLIYTPIMLSWRDFHRARREWLIAHSLAHWPAGYQCDFLQELRSREQEVAPHQLGFYCPFEDKIYISSRIGPDCHARVIFHELAHWTEHVRRCRRDVNGYGTRPDVTAREELTAEIAAQRLLRHFNIQVPRHSCDYIDSYLQFFSPDDRPRAAGVAAEAADKSVGWILERLRLRTPCWPGEIEHIDEAVLETLRPDDFF